MAENPDPGAGEAVTGLESLDNLSLIAHDAADDTNKNEDDDPAHHPDNVTGDESISFSSKDDVLDEPLQYHSLSEDVYSLMYTASTASSAFWFAFFFFAFQMVIICMLLWDIIAHGAEPGNPLNVQPGISIQVRITMALAVPLAVMTQSDLIVAALLLQQGYDERVLKQCPSATRPKWLLAFSCQFLAGSGLLIIIYILVLQAQNVLGMMLNFAALAFISEIDNGAFALAKNGFLSDRLELEANLVADLKVPVKRTVTPYLRRGLMLLVTACLMAGYGIITHQQLSGKFLCSNIRLQLSDGFNPEGPGFSGLYELTDSRIAGRATYLDQTHQVMLGYCDDTESWTLTYWSPDDDDSLRKDPCRWFAQSGETDTYDVTQTSDWVVDIRGALVAPFHPAPLQHFVLECVDCESSDDCGGKGECESGLCICDPGHFGTNCDFDEPCSEIVVDARLDPFPDGLSPDTLSTQYSPLREDDGSLVEVYGKPVFVHHDTEPYWSILVFVGTRWIATTSTNISRLYQSFSAAATQEELISFLKNFHAVFTPIHGFFISDVMDVKKPSDKNSPVGLGWYATKSNSEEGFLYNEVDLTQPVGTSFLCGVCNTKEGNGCYFGMTCGAVEEGVCDCDDGFQGALCEYHPSFS